MFTGSLSSIHQGVVRFNWRFNWNYVSTFAISIISNLMRPRSRKKIRNTFVHCKQIIYIVKQRNTHTHESMTYFLTANFYEFTRFWILNSMAMFSKLLMVLWSAQNFIPLGNTKRVPEIPEDFVNKINLSPRDCIV